MKWIIHDLLFGMAEQEEFMRALEKRGQKYEVFSTFANIPDGDIVRCSVDMAKVWRDHRGMMCTWVNYECSNYTPFFYGHLLVDNPTVTTYGDLRDNAADYFSIYGDKNGYIFLRPNSGGKTFVGEMVESEGLKRHREWYKDAWEDNLLVVVAKPVVIDREFRLVVVGDKAVSGSQYKSRDNLDKDLDLDSKRIEPDHEVFDYVNDVLSRVDYRPDPAFILDVAETKDGFKIIELNSFTCSGFYDCDPEPIVLAMASEGVCCA